jgi:hypothetical protein
VATAVVGAFALPAAAAGQHPARWDVSVDSTIMRAHQHAAGARTEPPPALDDSKGDAMVEHQDETPWQGLVGRLVDVVREARAWAARAAASPARST